MNTTFVISFLTLLALVISNTRMVKADEDVTVTKSKKHVVAQPDGSVSNAAAKTVFNEAAQAEPQPDIPNSQTQPLKLQTLMEDSKDITNEVRILFDKLTQRENIIIRDMEKMKVDLAEATRLIEDYNTVDNIGVQGQGYRMNGDSRSTFTEYGMNNGDLRAPYKACVEIDEENGMDIDENDFVSNRDIESLDLSHVYKIPLANRQVPDAMTKVQHILNGIKSEGGSDVLVIPVPKGSSLNYAMKKMAKDFAKK